MRFENERTMKDLAAKGGPVHQQIARAILELMEISYSNLRLIERMALRLFGDESAPVEGKATDLHGALAEAYPSLVFAPPSGGWPKPEEEILYGRPPGVSLEDYRKAAGMVAAVVAANAPTPEQLADIRKALTAGHTPIFASPIPWASVELMPEGLRIVEAIRERLAAGKVECEACKGAGFAKVHSEAGAKEVACEACGGAGTIGEDVPPEERAKLEERLAAMTRPLTFPDAWAGKPDPLADLRATMARLDAGQAARIDYASAQLEKVKAEADAQFHVDALGKVTRGLDAARSRIDAPVAGGPGSEPAIVRAYRDNANAHTREPFWRQMLEESRAQDEAFDSERIACIGILLEAWCRVYSVSKAQACGLEGSFRNCKRAPRFAIDCLNAHLGVMELNITDDATNAAAQALRSVVAEFGSAVEARYRRDRLADEIAKAHQGHWTAEEWARDPFWSSLSDRFFEEDAPDADAYAVLIRAWRRARSIHIRSGEVVRESIGNNPITSESVRFGLRLAIGEIRGWPEGDNGGGDAKRAAEAILRSAREIWPDFDAGIGPEAGGK